MYFPLPAAMLEFLILGFLEKQDSYGYEICQTIKEIQDIKEPVLYPILKKLQTAGLIDSYEEKHGGRRRKYYQLTQAGKKQLAQLKADWLFYQTHINQITGLQPALQPAH